MTDVGTMRAVLDGLGASSDFSGHTLELDTADVDSYTAPYELVRQMRASIVVLGPLATQILDTDGRGSSELADTLAAERGAP